MTITTAVGRLTRRLCQDLDPARSVRVCDSGIYVWRPCKVAYVDYECFIPMERIVSLVRDGVFATDEERDFLVDNRTPMESMEFHIDTSEEVPF